MGKVLWATTQSGGNGWRWIL